MASKLLIGSKVRHLREERGWRLEECARRLAISPSYLSQIETNQRPVTTRVLLALARTLEVDLAALDVSDDDRLISDLREAALESAIIAPAPGLQEIKRAVQHAPGLVQQFLALHASHRRLQERLRSMDEAVALDESAVASAQLPYEEVRDYFHYRDNYVDSLDRAAEALGVTWKLGTSASAEPAMLARLEACWGVKVIADSGDGDLLRAFDAETGVLRLSTVQSPTSRVFQMACALAALEFHDQIEDELNVAGLRSDTAKAVCRVGLVNYAAAALLMPYQTYREAAQRELHDIERLQHLFQISFEQACHRLSTLQRPAARGVPFYFVRVDQAGNITKRHSATRFQFARFGGACPLWNVHDAFAEPGRILVQIAEMPEGDRYLCVARGIIKRSGSYRGPHRRYAVGLGCEIQHASSLVYSQGLDLRAPAAAIGVSCRICPRPDCRQRAFPPLDRPLRIPGNERRIVPYEVR